MRPEIVCLCGSTRFGEAFRDANLALTLEGCIVLSIGCEWHSDQGLGLTQEDKQRLDELHLRKIDLADRVRFLNVGGYLGHSSLIEHFYASVTGKEIEYLEKPEPANRYYVESEKVGVMWLREQQKIGRYTRGLRLINRQTWFLGDNE